MTTKSHCTPPLSAISSSIYLYACDVCSNVQSHPDDDIYRRVRVSSDRFHRKVWQYSDARQFLARAGWVEVRAACE